MSTFLKTAGLSSIICLTLGCQSMYPSWSHPGPHELQRSRAVAHDPYPDNDAGPDIDDVRPLDYQKPRAEAVRNQPHRNFFGGW